MGGVGGWSIWSASWSEHAGVSVVVSVLQWPGPSVVSLSVLPHLQEEKPKLKVITVLDQRRANNILIEISRLPAPRHIKTAILNMDYTHFTKEVVEVCAHTHTHQMWWCLRHWDHLVLVVHARASLDMYRYQLEVLIETCTYTVEGHW